jgi:predicted DNA-binding protein
MLERDQGRFTSNREKPLSKKNTCCRLPVEIEEKLTQFFADKDKTAKNDWLRRVISEAVENELTK